MSDGSYTLKDAMAAEAAAAEAVIAAEKLLRDGALFAYAAAFELAKRRRQRADRIKARVACRSVLAATTTVAGPSAEHRPNWT